MKLIIFPLLIVSLPVALLFLTIKCWKKGSEIPKWLKIVLGILFGTLGLVLTFVAVIISIQGYMEIGVRCATGAVAFIPIGMGLTFAGVPLLLIFERKIRGIK